MQHQDRTETSLALGGLLLTTLIWAGNIVIARGVQDLIPPLGLSFWRTFLALLVVAPFALVPVWRQRGIIRTHWRWLLLLAMLGVALPNTLLYVAAHSTSAVNISLINSAMPVLVLALAWLVLRNPLSLHRTLGLGCALAGILYIIGDGAPGKLLRLEFQPGDLFMLASVMAWSSFSVLLKLYPIPLRTLEFMAVQLLLGAAVLLPGYLIERQLIGAFTWSAQVWAPLAYVAIPQSLLAYALWNYGIQRLGPQVAASSAYLVPLFVVLLAWLTLGEQPAAHHYWGGSLVLFGVYLATRPN